MKKIYCFLGLFIIACTSFAANEQVWVVTNSGSGYAKTPSELGSVAPCSTIPFYVDVHMPSGYVVVAKYEWFVNGTSVLVSTDPSNPILEWPITSNSVTVYCKVTYQNQNGELTTPSSSSTFTPVVKGIDFHDITTTSPDPNYGCSTTIVSYSLVETPCTGSGFPCSGIFNVLGNYNITWQAPAGWVQTSISNNGSNVSFMPDATSGGSVVATIHLSCGYTSTRFISVSRTPQSPIFTTSNVQACNSSTSTMSISPICGALDYTYTIEGNPGVKFSANGQQTLTTTLTSIDFTLPTGNSENSIKARANYSNNVISDETKGILLVGLKTPNFDIYNPDGACTGNIYEAIGTSNSGSNLNITYNWYINDVLDPYDGYKIRRTFPADYTEIKLSVSKPGCGTSDEIRKVFTCPQSFSISPNPATTEVAIESKSADILRIRIMDKLGTLKKEIPYSNKSKKVRIAITDLRSDVYTIQIFDGIRWESHLFIKQ